MALLIGKAGKMCADSDFFRVVRVGGGCQPSKGLRAGGSGLDSLEEVVEAGKTADTFWRTSTETVDEAAMTYIGGIGIALARAIPYPLASH